MTRVWGAVDRQTIKPVLSEAGFEGSGATYTRRLGSADQRIAFRSRGRGDIRAWHMDVGWSLDEVTALADSFFREQVGGEGMQVTAQVVDAQPGEWTLSRDAVVEHAVTGVRAGIERIVAAFDRLDSPAAVLEHVDLDYGFLALGCAQLRFVFRGSAGARSPTSRRCTTDSTSARASGLAEILACAGISVINTATTL